MIAIRCCMKHALHIQIHNSMLIVLLRVTTRITMYSTAHMECERRMQALVLTSRGASAGRFTSEDPRPRALALDRFE